MAVINPYIHFNGNAEEAFTFYKSVLGGEFIKVVRYKEISSKQYPIPENDANKIMHIALPISHGSVLRASDAMAVMGKVTENDNRNTIFITAESQEEADKLFNGLSAGSKVEMPINYGPWGNYFGMFTDKLACNGWWILIRTVKRIPERYSAEASGAT
jgi:PhnB protein